MKRYIALIAVMVSATIAQAQQRTLDPEVAQRLGEVAKQLVVQQNYWGKLGAYNNWAIGGAWWTNAALAAQLGLSDDQKAKLQRAFENHRQALTSNTEQLNKEEAQLAKLLETETIDRNAILAQIDRVVQARADLERTNAAMTLEMREALTRAQWIQVPQPTAGLAAVRLPVLVNGGGGRGQRNDGQRNGGQRQQ